MTGFVLPAAFAALTWWFTTGIILFLDGLAVRTFRWSLSAASAVAVAALFGLRGSAADTSTKGAYAAFLCAILIWGWLEMSFLMGFMTGPRKTGCASDCAGWRHFVHATEAVIYNELGTVAAAAVVCAITWDAPNRCGLWTFLVLWTMRLSAKLNLFLGVPNVGEKFLPPHLRYLSSFFRTRAMNLLFPLSVTVATGVLLVWVQRYLAETTAAREAGYALLITLLGLALVEHWFMVLPLPSERLWSWALRTDRKRRDSHDEDRARKMQQPTDRRQFTGDHHDICTR